MLKLRANLSAARSRMTKKLIIAIDGPVGSGKSTLARRVAELLGYVYVDTGRDVPRAGVQGAAERPGARWP